MPTETREPINPAPAISMTELLATAARVACQGVGLLLIVMGAMYAVSVFSSVAALVKDPQGMQSPVQSVAKTIEADKLAVIVNGQAISLGGSVAMVLLLMWYAFLVWIPLALIKTGGKLIYWTLHKPQTQE